MRITCVEHVGNHWEANASLAGQTLRFHNRFGSWQTKDREAHPEVAARLQKRIKQEVRREDRNASVREH